MPSKFLESNMILSYDMMGIPERYPDYLTRIKNSIMSSNKELLLKTFQSSMSLYFVGINYLERNG